MIAFLTYPDFVSILHNHLLGNIFAGFGASGDVSMEEGQVFLCGKFWVFGLQTLDIAVEVGREGFVFVDGDGGS